MDPLKKIYRDLENKIRGALPTIAYEIGDEMFNKYKSCVDVFYGHMPESDRYYRTYSTYLGSSISYDYGETSSGSVNTKNGKETTFSINVNMQVDPSYLGSPYKDPVDYVFNRTWGEGIHGTLANPQLSPSPQASFEKWFYGFFKPVGARRIAMKGLSASGFSSK